MSRIYTLAAQQTGTNTPASFYSPTNGDFIISSLKIANPNIKGQVWIKIYILPVGVPTPTEGNLLHPKKWLDSSELYSCLASVCLSTGQSLYIESGLADNTNVHPVFNLFGTLS